MSAASSSSSQSPKQYFCDRMEKHSRCRLISQSVWPPGDPSFGCQVLVQHRFQLAPNSIGSSTIKNAVIEGELRIHAAFARREPKVEHRSERRYELKRSDTATLGVGV